MSTPTRRRAKLRPVRRRLSFESLTMDADVIVPLRPPNVLLDRAASLNRISEPAAPASTTRRATRWRLPTRIQNLLSGGRARCYRLQTRTKQTREKVATCWKYSCWAVTAISLLLATASFIHTVSRSGTDQNDTVGSANLTIWYPSSSVELIFSTYDFSFFFYRF